MRQSIIAIMLIAAVPQTGNLPFEARPFDLKLPEGMYVEEIPGIAVSPDGERLYVFNRGRHALLAFSRDGQFVKEIGHGLFEVPHGLRGDSEGNLWTTDTGTHVVIKFSPEGKVLMVLGKKGTASVGWFDRDYNQLFLNKPSDVAFDDEGNVYVADGGNFRVVKYSKTGDVLLTFGEQGSDAGQFNFPHSLVVDSTGRLLVADRENRRIQLFDVDGVYQVEWADVGYPYTLALGSESTIWMTDARADQLVKLSPDGQRLGTFGGPGKSLGRYGFLHGVVPVGDGLLVSDILNWKIEHLRTL